MLHIRLYAQTTLNSLVTIACKVLKDFTSFSDGTFIRKERWLLQPLHPCTITLWEYLRKSKSIRTVPVFWHIRGRWYGTEIPICLDVDWAFAFRTRQACMVRPFVFSLVYVCSESIPWLNVSPGHFFAANELNSMLAHVVVTYDVKLEDDATSPKSWSMGTLVTADPRAKVMFRSRVDWVASSFESLYSIPHLSKPARDIVLTSVEKMVPEKLKA